MKKVLTIFGTRPEAIKMAMLCRKLSETEGIDHKVCVTAQHRQMLDQVLDFFEIRPDFDLDIMKAGQDLTDITCEVLKGLRELFKSYRPDMILVHGDTTTCMAASLAAFYAGIKIGHVEAGLRTGNLQSPFPEEANRVLVSKLADLNFSATEINRQNLLSEGINPEKIIVTGNTVIDSLLFAKNKINSFSKDMTDLLVRIIFENHHPHIILVTGHRRENFGDGFINICRALKKVAQKHPEVEIVYPVHLNPKVQKPVNKVLNGIPNVHLIKPLSYPDFVFAMKQSFFLLTDSGGIQEEAPGLGKPVLVMRDTTERPEAVGAGTAKLVGADFDKIRNGIERLLTDENEYNTMAKAHNPYGDGKAVGRIIDKLVRDYLNDR
ncbi:MAG TPA: UDP-N-acetylglucosamine 2-epimerase (non-hydrolyzing) [Hanamia sp.]|nr:UDP-N-acetylglucosamine 2-epimerase (non-hydrolyzing) [Hanamia sp.]